MAGFARVVLTLWNLTMWDRVSDPVSRPKGPRARCGQSMSIAVVYLAMKKLIPLSSSPSPRIVAGNFLHSPRRCSRLLPERVRPQIQPACGVVMPTHVHLIYSPLRRTEDQRSAQWKRPGLAGGILRPRPPVQRGPTTGSCTEWSMSARIRLGVSTEVRVPVDLGSKDSCALGGGAESQRPFRPPDRVKDPVP